MAFFCRWGRSARHHLVDELVEGPGVSRQVQEGREELDQQLSGLCGLGGAEGLASCRHEPLQAFLAAEEDVVAQGFDARFRRMWEFYLAYCEGGFAEKQLGDLQIVLAKPGARVPAGPPAAPTAPPG